MADSRTFHNIFKDFGIDKFLILWPMFG